MDFQSRINQFRQNLKDQQENFNNLASTASQFGRSIIPDKVAQHLEYVEQVGGIITGASAGLHGAMNVGKKIQKFRAAKAQKRTPTGRKTQQEEIGEARTTDETRQIAEAEADKQTAATKVEDTIKPTEAGKPSEAAELAETGGVPQKQGVRAREDDEELDLDDLASERQAERAAVRQGKQPAVGETTEEDFGGSVEDALTASIRGQKGTDLFQSLRYKGQGRGDTATQVEEGEGEVGDDPFAGIDFSAREGLSVGKGVAGEFDTGQNIGNVIMGKIGGSVVPKSDTPIRPAGTAEGDASQAISSKAAEADDFTKNLLGKDPESVLPDIGDVAGAAKEAVVEGAKKVVGKALGAAGEAAGEIGGEAIASAVPVIGELFGLGMVIRGIIEHHKHEENAPPPKLSAPNPEATEQSGGFSDTMLKGMSSAPSIV